MAEAEASASSEITIRPSERPPVKERDPTLSIRHEKWQELAPWLKECGYELSARYQPGWEPGAKGSREDREVLPRNFRGFLEVATRIRDGSKLVLKYIDTMGQRHQVGFHQYFSEPLRLNSSDNHGLRVFDILRNPERDADVILVLPYLRVWNDPPMQTIGEALSMFAQLAEGLKYMHDAGMSYGSPLMHNVLYGPPVLKASKKHERPRVWSRTLTPQKYYFVDFSRSRLYSQVPEAYEQVLKENWDFEEQQKNQPIPGQRERWRAPLCKDGKARLEQLGGDLVWFPFSEDVYNLGRFFDQEFRCLYAGFDWMRPLLSTMTDKDPMKRPNIDQVIQQFTELRRYRTFLTYRARLRDPLETIPEKLVNGTSHLVKTTLLVLCGTRAAPPKTRAERLLAYK